MNRALSFALGDVGQRICMAELMRRGLKVLSVRDYTDASKAPMFRATKDSLIAPDMLVLGHEAKDGEHVPAFWFECKTKKSAGFRRDRNRHEHGIDLKHWTHYQSVERETGLPVRLAFLELDTLECRWGWISELEPALSGTGLVYFSRDSLAHFFSTSRAALEREVTRMPILAPVKSALRHALNQGA